MIYFTGDMHGQQERFAAPAMKKLREDDTLIICGDFGFLWENNTKEQRFLDKMEKKKFNICFLDGTHENFEALNDFPIVLFAGGKAHRVRRNVFHLMRGQVFQIEGKKIFTLGGGESPESALKEDEELDTVRYEIPDRNEMLEAVRNLEQVNYTVDYIATHEPPAGIRAFLLMSEDEIPAVSALGAFLDELKTTATYEKWFFGSLHTDKHISPSMTSVFEKILDPVTGKSL